jgi:hypothetical protein
MAEKTNNTLDHNDRCVGALEDVIDALVRASGLTESIELAVASWSEAVPMKVTQAMPRLAHHLLTWDFLQRQLEDALHTLWTQAVRAKSTQVLERNLASTEHAWGALRTATIELLLSLVAERHVLLNPQDEEALLGQRLRRVRIRAETLLQQNISLSWRLLLHSDDPSVLELAQVTHGARPTIYRFVVERLNQNCDTISAANPLADVSVETAAAPCAGTWVSTTTWGTGGDYEIRVSVGGFDTKERALEFGACCRLLRIERQLVVCSSAAQLLTDEHVCVYRLSLAAQQWLEYDVPIVTERDFEPYPCTIAEFGRHESLNRLSYESRSYGACAANASN